MAWKLLMAGILAALSLATLAGLLYLQLLVISGENAAAGTFPTRVVGPSGDLWSGEVRVENATALAALAAAAQAGGFRYHVREYAHGSYVDEIAGHRESGGAGWIYLVTRSGREEFPAVAADRYFLRAGDAVAWEWSQRPDHRTGGGALRSP